MRRLVALSALLVGCSLLVSLDDLRATADGGSDAGDASAEGGCGDTKTSSVNCGACGHGCLGGECKASVCQPVALASIQKSPSSIAVDSSFVYWIDSAAEFWRAPIAALDAGASRVGGQGVQNLSWLNVQQAALFGYSGLANNVVTVAANEPPDGSAPQSVANYGFVHDVASFAVDPSHNFVLFAGNLCPSGKSCLVATDRDGGNLTALADNLALGSTRFVSSDGTLFFYSLSAVSSVSLASPAPVLLASDAMWTSITSIGADSNGVYITVDALGTVVGIPRAGVGDGGAAAVLTSGLAHPALVVAAAGLLAWKTDDGLMGCDPTRCASTLATYVSAAQAAVSSIAVDSAAIYWTDPNRAGIYKIAR